MSESVWISLTETTDSGEMHHCLWGEGKAHRGNKGLELTTWRSWAWPGGGMSKCPWRRATTSSENSHGEEVPEAGLGLLKGLPAG